MKKTLRDEDFREIAGQYRKFIGKIEEEREARLESYERLYLFKRYAESFVDAYNKFPNVTKVNFHYFEKRLAKTLDRIALGN